MIDRRSLLMSATALALGAIPRAAGAAEPESAKTFINSLANDAILLMARKDLPAPERTQQFRELFKRGFDVAAIGRFVLGRYWRQAMEPERTEYLRLFDELVVQTYARRFNEFNTARLRVLSVSRPNEDNDVIVVVEGAVVGKPPVRLDVRVRQGSSAYKVIDVSIEGVSMAVTQRDEFSSVIQRGGGRIEALLASLREKVGAR